MFDFISIYEIIAILLIIVLTVYYMYKNKGSGENDVLTTIAQLETKTDIVTQDITYRTILGTGTSTVMGFFYLQDGNRTQTYNNTYIPILYCANNWWLEISYAPNGNHTTAQLRVHTNKNNTTKKETIELPSIPKQKWVFIAILRDGRRFDVIYDNQIVASKRLKYYPVVISSPLSIGDKQCKGKATHIIINSKRLLPNEVETKRRAYVDSNNHVLEDNQIISLLPNMKFAAECLPGLPCDPVTKPPQNKMLKWNTPYA